MRLRTGELADPAQVRPRVGEAGSDLCAAENIPFVLGYALYMKAIHGGKTKDDDLDAFAFSLKSETEQPS